MTDVRRLDVAGAEELAGVLLVGLVAVAAGTGRLDAGTLHAGRGEGLAGVLLVGLVVVAARSCGADSHGSSVKQSST